MTLVLCALIGMAVGFMGAVAYLVWEVRRFKQDIRLHGFEVATTNRSMCPGCGAATGEKHWANCEYFPAGWTWQ